MLTEKPSRVGKFEIAVGKSLGWQNLNEIGEQQ